jgi:hypothetical protein
LCLCCVTHFLCQNTVQFSHGKRPHNAVLSVHEVEGGYGCLTHRTQSRFFVGKKRGHSRLVGNYNIL